MPKTVKVKVEVPEGISDDLQKVAESRAQEAVILALWEAASLSTRQAAEELGLSYHEFLDLLTKRGIPVESGPLDLEAIEQTQRKLKGSIK